MVTSALQIRPSAPPTRTLREVAEMLRASARAVTVDGDDEIVCTGLALDSRQVLAGDVWLAVQGMTHHGAQHWQQAESNGCVAVITDSIGAELLARSGTQLPVVTVEDISSIVGPLSAWFYGTPAEHLYTVGVTGTNGKTSMTHFLVAAWAALEASPVACVGTLGVRVYSGAQVENTATGFTTPEAPVLHGCLESLRQQDVRRVALEISSHALALGRVDGFCVDLAIFTNLSHDHLDFHTSMRDYFDAKALLFTQAHSKQALVCVDEEWGRLLAANLREAGRPVTTYGASDADFCMRGFGNGTCLVTHGGVDSEFAFSGPGTFNAVNATGTFAALLLQGVARDRAIAAMSAISQVPGRMEVVSSASDPLTVVDYAHSPDSVERVLEALRNRTAGRLIAVLGAGGDRDPIKRPLMGTAAVRGGADVIVVTDDNPRSEDPAQIRAAVRSEIDGLSASGAATAAVLEIGDRAEAIAAAVAMAQDGDTVAILGKGAETGQQVGAEFHPFDDREVARECLARRQVQSGAV